MSKIKDALLMQEQKEFEIDFGYEEWLYENKVQQLSVSDVNKMEEELVNPSTVSNHILSEVALNNANYNPQQGETL